MRYIRHVEFVNERVSKWYPAKETQHADGSRSRVTEPDGKEYFWSDDPIFKTMEKLRNAQGNRQWKIVNGKASQVVDSLTSEQKTIEIERRFQLEYNLTERQKILEDAQEAKMDGASDSDEAIVAFKKMRDRRKAIEVEVDKL